MCAVRAAHCVHFALVLIALFHGIIACKTVVKTHTPQNNWTKPKRKICEKKRKRMKKSMIYYCNLWFGLVCIWVRYKCVWWWGCLVDENNRYSNPAWSLSIAFSLSNDKSSVTWMFLSAFISFFFLPSHEFLQAKIEINTMFIPQQSHNFVNLSAQNSSLVIRNVWTTKNEEKS